MMRVACGVVGMKVITPLGHIGRIEGVVLDSRDDRQFFNVRYLDATISDEPVALQGKLLRLADGVTLFPDEVERLRRQYAEKPKGAA